MNNPGLKCIEMWRGAEKHCEEEAEEKLQPGEKDAEVVASSCKQVVYGVTLSSGEIVTAHVVAVLDVASDRFDGSTPLYLALDGWLIIGNTDLVCKANNVARLSVPAQICRVMQPTANAQIESWV